VSIRVATVWAALLGLAVSVSTATAQMAIRIDDAEVADQMEQVQRALDRFVGGPRPSERTAAAMRGGQGAADLRPALNGLRASASRMAAAYRPPTRNATEEVIQVLGQAKAIESRLAAAAGVGGFEARWAPVAESLVQLGHAYRIDWRAASSDWVPRRVSDQELRLAAASLRVAAHDLDEMLGAVLDKDKLMDRTEHARAIQLLKSLSSAIHDLLKRFEHYDDLTTPIQRATRAAAALTPFMEAYPGADPVKPQWLSVNQALQAIAQGFGM
jgi:hypothetical protein